MNDMSHKMRHSATSKGRLAAFLTSRFTIMWLLLVAITLFSWETAVIQDQPGLGATIVLALAYLKIRIIGLEFMELRTAPIPMRLFYELWSAGLTLMLIGQYWGYVFK